MTSTQVDKAANLRALRESGWKSKTVKQEIRDNFVSALSRRDELFPGIVGYDDTEVMQTLVHEMVRTGARRGLAALCIGVGQGLATLIEGRR